MIASYITEVTRRRLIECLGRMSTPDDKAPTFLAPSYTFWSGALEETEFLARLYDLGELPSNDSRYTTAFQDIVQHRMANDDWDDDWIFTDARFGLTEGDERLLAFLAEMLHPAVRTDLSQVEHLRGLFNGILAYDGYELVPIDDISSAPIFAPHRVGVGVRGTMKNLIFAAVGPKPEIVLDDAVNNELRIVRGEENCLVYDRPLGAHGLTWAELTAWWAERQGISAASGPEMSRSLYHRLAQSLGNNGAELRILRTYANRYVESGSGIPALIPQVYLYYDPYTQDRYVPGAAPLQRQRMDFLMLLPNRVRVVIECDGRQHYAEADGAASPRRYAAMMAEDRDLRLRGYEVYRFGGLELTDSPATTQLLDDFFGRLLGRYT